MNKEKFWIGIVNINGRREIFLATAYDATPEKSGYDKVEGPFDTEEEAKENL